MALMIVVSKPEFDRLFEETLRKLELENLKQKSVDRGRAPEEGVASLHRTFHYEVCQLKDRLEGRIL